MSKRSRSDIRELEYRMEIERRRRARQDQQMVEEMKKNYQGCAGNRLHSRRDFLHAGIHVPFGTAILSSPLLLLPKHAAAQNEFCGAAQGGGGTKFISLNFNCRRGCNMYGDFVAGEDPNDPAGSRGNLTNTTRLGRTAASFQRFGYEFGIPMFTDPGSRYHGMMTVFQDAAIDPKQYINGFWVCTDSNDDTRNNPNSGAHIMAKMNSMLEAYADVLGTQTNRPAGVDTTLAPGSLDNSLRVSVTGNGRGRNEEYVNLGRVTQNGGNGWGFSKGLATNVLSIIKDLTNHDLNVGFKFLDNSMKKFIECGTTAAAASLQTPSRPYKLAADENNPTVGEDAIITALLNRALTGTVNNTTQDLNQNNVQTYGNIFALALNDYCKHGAFETPNCDEHTRTGPQIEVRAEIEGIMIARAFVAAILKSRVDGTRRQIVATVTTDGSAAHNGNATANGRFGGGSDAGDFSGQGVFLCDTGVNGLGGKQPKTTKFNSGNPANGAQLGALKNNGINADDYPELGGNNSAHVPYIIARIVSIWLTGGSALFKNATANSGSPITSMTDSEFNAKFAVIAPAT